MEVSIHAVSPESSFGAAGACAAAGSVSTSIDVASISRCKTRYTDFINFLQETDKRGNEPSPDPWAGRVAVGYQESCQSTLGPAILARRRLQPAVRRSSELVEKVKI